MFESIERIELYHRLPSPYDSGLEFRNEIKREFKTLPFEKFWEFLNVGNCFSTHFVKDLNPDHLKIINYRLGTLSIDEMGINSHNAVEFLKTVKLVDLAYLYHVHTTRSCLQFKNSTYIRERILEVLSPTIQTAEVFTNTLNPSNLKSEDYLKQSKKLDKRTDWVLCRQGNTRALFECHLSFQTAQSLISKNLFNERRYGSWQDNLLERAF